MSTYALGALVAYRPDHPEGVWDSRLYEVVGRMTREWTDRSTQVWYTLMLHTPDRDWWHLRPIALVRAEQLRPYPPARCRDCGVVLQPHASTSTACGECTTWARHLQPQEVR